MRLALEIFFFLLLSLISLRDVFIKRVPFRRGLVDRKNLRFLKEQNFNWFFKWRWILSLLYLWVHSNDYKVSTTYVKNNSIGTIKRKKNHGKLRKFTILFSKEFLEYKCHFSSNFTTRLDFNFLGNFMLEFFIRHRWNFLF